MLTEIRELSIEDIESLVEVARESWKWTYAEIYSEEYIDSWIRDKYSKEKLLNEIARSKSNIDILFLGSFADSKLIGFIELKIIANKAELLRLYLKPEYTHKKIGKTLLLEAEKIMKKKGILECRLYVHRQNIVGVFFYIKNGFKIIGIEDHDLIMEKIYSP